MPNRLGINCSKKNPLLCRRHGNQYRAAQQLYAQVRAQESLKKLQAISESDFAASWKLKEETDGTTTVSVYRSGVPKPPAERGVEKQSYEAADQFIPEGRASRMQAVFAAPTLGGVCRWVKGNFFGKILDVKVRELRVDIDKAYVYNIQAWEKASSWEKPEFYKAFWETGMTMREYMTAAKKDPETFKPSEWELMLSEDQIRSVKPVGAERATQNSYYNETDEVRNILLGKKNYCV